MPPPPPGTNRVKDLFIVFFTCFYDCTQMVLYNMFSPLVEVNYHNYHNLGFNKPSIVKMGMPLQNVTQGLSKIPNPRAIS